MSTSRSTRVRIAEFKARLSYYLRAVRSGRSLTVYDRETPVARVVPVEGEPGGLRTRKPLGRLSDVRIPEAPAKPVDSLKALMEERGER